MKTKILILGIMTSLFLMACNHDYLIYDEQLKEGIYFLQGDSLNFQFGLNTKTDVPFKLIVGIIGKPTDKDRTWHLELDMEKTTAREGIHFDFDKNLTIKAGTVSDTIQLIFHRYSDPLLTEQTFDVCFRLVEDECFRPVMTTTCKIEMSDKEIPELPYWKYSRSFFGPYSQTLYLALLEKYHALAETMPGYYERMVKEMGENLEKMFGMPSQYSMIMKKYVLLPVYEYFQEYPDPKVNMPDPRNSMY